MILQGVFFYKNLNTPSKTARCSLNKQYLRHMRKSPAAASGERAFYLCRQFSGRMEIVMTKSKQKKDKKRIIVILLLAAAVLCSAVFLLGEDGNANDGSPSAVVKNNDDRIAYLESFGWEVAEEPIEEVTVTIPQYFDEVFRHYNEIQIEQGFDLSKYAGLEAVRYTYSITNYPTGETCIVADIIVYRNEVIAGDVQSTALEGFMHGLAMPQSDSQ